MSLKFEEKPKPLDLVFVWNGLVAQQISMKIERV